MSKKLSSQGPWTIFGQFSDNFWTSFGHCVVVLFSAWWTFRMFFIFFSVRGLSAPKSRDSLRLRRRFLPLPKESRFFEAPRCTISSARKIACEPRFLLRRKWVKMVLAAEFPAIPSSAVKIASERRCAILVHSARGREGESDAPRGGWGSVLY